MLTFRRLLGWVVAALLISTNIESLAHWWHGAMAPTPVIAATGEEDFSPGAIHVALTAPDVWGFTAFGGDLYSAQAGIYVMYHHRDTLLFAWNTGADPPYREQYSLGRSFAAYDLRQVPAGRVISATLELAPLTGGRGLSAPVYIYQTDWDGPLPPWNAPVGALLATVAPQEQWVSLPALVGQPAPAILRLTLRTAEDIHHTGSTSTGRAFRVRPDDHSPDQAVSVLHLWIEAPP